MSNVHITQQGQLGLAFGLLTALGGLTAFLAYLETKKHSKLQEEILKLDRNIKELQLNKLQS
jgi:hypothetical protein